MSVGNERIFQTWIVYLLLLADFTKGIFLVFSVSPYSCQDSTHIQDKLFYLKWHKAASN